MPGCQLSVDDSGVAWLARGGACRAVLVTSDRKHSLSVGVEIRLRLSSEKHEGRQSKGCGESCHSGIEKRSLERRAVLGFCEYLSS